MLDAQRLGPDDDETAVAAEQLRAVVEQLVALGHWAQGDPDIWIVADSGYDGPRLAFLLADLPVQLLVRLRADRVLAFPAPPRPPAATGRPARHGPEFTFKDPRTWPEPAHTTTTQTSRYGTAVAQAWDRLHPRLTHRGTWADHDGEPPIMEGTVIRLHVDHLPGDGDPKPLWLWFSRTGTTAADMDRLWRMYLRRFDLEHTFRLTMGWTKPHLRTPEAADRWTWLMISAHTQLRLARHLVEDQPRPWERSVAMPRLLTPARVRRGFPQHPTDHAPASRRTETLTAWPRPPTRIAKRHTSDPTRPRQEPQKGQNGTGSEDASRLNDKLSSCSATSR